MNPETTAIDVSGWKISGEVTHTLKPGTVIPAGETLYLTPNAVAFRARLDPPHGNEALFVQGNYPGQLSARGGTLTLTDTGGAPVATTNYVGSPSPAQSGLRITEIMFNAPGTDAAEFIELRNTGSVPIPLAGVRFSEGISFEWTDPGASLPALRRAPVRDAAAFTAAYPGVTVGGVFTGSLANNGERLQLTDAIAENILDFDYEDDWYPATDGRGCSLVVVNEPVPPSAWDSKTNWHPSHLHRGTPGAPDPPAPHDSDADGQDDCFEATFADPVNPASRFDFTVSAAPAISFPAAAGMTYFIEQSSDLVSWAIHSTVGPFSQSLNATVPLTPPAGASYFFRLTTDPPAAQ